MQKLIAGFAQSSLLATTGRMMARNAGDKIANCAGHHHRRQHHQYISSHVSRIEQNLKGVMHMR